MKHQQRNEEDVQGGKNAATDPDRLRQGNGHVFPQMLKGITGKRLFE